MALHEIEVSGNIIDVAITLRLSPRPRAVIGVLYHHGYSQFEWPISSMIQYPPICRFTSDFWSTNKDIITKQDTLYLQTSFVGDLGLYFSKSMDRSTFTVLGEDGGYKDQIVLLATDIEGMVRNSSISMSKTRIVLDADSQSNNDELEKMVRDTNNAVMTDIELTLSLFSAQRVDSILCEFSIEHRVSGLTNGTGMPASRNLIFSLAESGSLFANERRVVRNCTSFLVTPAHLIFTTSQHLLKFVHFTRDAEGELSLTPFLVLCSYNTSNRTRDTS